MSLYCAELLNKWGASDPKYSVDAMASAYAPLPKPEKRRTEKRKRGKRNEIVETWTRNTKNQPADET